MHTEAGIKSSIHFLLVLWYETKNLTTARKLIQAGTYLSKNTYCKAMQKEEMIKNIKIFFLSLN